MANVKCDFCPEDGDGPPVDMVFREHRGPYQAWFDQTAKRTVRANEVGSRCVREFWCCPKCVTVRWFDILVDLKMGDLPPEERDAWKKRLHL
jgi:hypothetical protein